MISSNSETGLWLVPDWPAPAQVRALCTTRHGGVSGAPYDTLNLGLHVGDAADAVMRNRTLLQQRLGVRPVFMNQVHGTQLLQLQPGIEDHLEADGALTRLRELACTVMVADCLPILLCDRIGRQVAAVHAGWRGLVGVGGEGVVEQAVKQFSAMAPVDIGFDATEIIAWLGPCIGPRAFEVGDDVRQAFTQGDPAAQGCFVDQAPGKWLADLAGLARLRLRRSGVAGIYGNDGSDIWCTVNQSSHFFSHRRDKVSGRMAACIWLV